MPFRVKALSVTILLAFVLNSFTSYAQNKIADPLRVAVLLPLYIDSAFANNTYTLDENNIPQYILSGLDFYNGVMLAVDTLQKEGANLEVFIYDTKSSTKSLTTLLSEIKTMNISMVIASLTNANEQKKVSDFSFNYNIPLISATYPNDAGLDGNPFFVMLNSTLKTHVDGIYDYLQNNYARSQPLFLTNKGALEQKILSYFSANDNGSNALKYRTQNLNENFYEGTLLSMLDSNKQNVIVCGSLNRSYALKVAETISNAQSYRATIIGMPNWDGFRDLDRLTNDKIQIVYSTPYKTYRDGALGNTLTEAYRSKFYSRPSDMVFKGFETMYHFTHLLMQYKYDIINHLSEDKYHVGNRFDIEPVKLDPHAFIPDYQENKTLYFVTKVTDSITSVKPLHN